MIVLISRKFEHNDLMIYFMIFIFRIIFSTDYIIERGNSIMNPKFHQNVESIEILKDTKNHIFLYIESHSNDIVDFGFYYINIHEIS